MLSFVRKLFRRTKLTPRPTPRRQLLCRAVDARWIEPLESRLLLAGATGGIPDVAVSKGIVASSSAGAVFDTGVGPAGVTFAQPATTDAPFTGIISSEAIRTGPTPQPLDANLLNARPGDTLRFAVTLENRSSGGTAFDVAFRDSLPSGVQYQPDTLQIFDGTGQPLAYRDLDGRQDGSGVFGSGIQLEDAGSTHGTFAEPELCGSLDAASATSPGKNIAVAFYDVTVLNALGSTAAFNSSAQVVRFAQTEGGPNLAVSGSDAASFTLERIDLELTTSTSNPAPLAGDLVTWTVTVTNRAANATAAATGIVVSNALPPGHTIISGSAIVPAGGSFDAAAGLWNVGRTLNVGESAQLTFQTIAGNGVEFSAALVDLELHGSVLQPTVTEGETVTWQVTVTNNSESAVSAATGVQISGLLPAGLNILSHTVTAGAFDSATGIWDVSAEVLAPGQSEQILISATAAAGTAGSTLQLRPEISAVGETDIDSVPADNSITEDDDFTASITVRPGAGTRTISGRVFLDNDNNGTDTSEPGVQNITVTAYASNGSVAGTGTTDASGLYSLSGVTADAVRLEFTGLPADRSVTTADSPPAAANTISSLAFINAGTSPVTADLAVYRPEAKAEFVTTCFVYSGQSTLDPTTEPAVVVFNSDGSVKSAVATIAQVGSTNGLAVQGFSNDHFAASFHKRHSDTGPGGNSAIYRIDSAGNVSTFIRLDDFAGADSTGAYSHDPSDWFTDAPAFSAVGKVSLGDLDVSEDGRFLYTINLATRELIEIPIGTSGNPAPVDYLPGDARTIRTIPILGDDAVAPTNGGIPLSGLGADPTGNIRPFAIAVRNGVVYVGMVYSAETTGNDAELTAYVYAFDPAGGAFSTTPAAAFNLDSRITGNGWQAWTDVWSDLPKFYEPAGDYFTVGRNQPWLTDIEFDDNGDMILGFRDRTGDQVGHMVGDPTGADSDSNGSPDRFYHDTKGDILHLRRTGSDSWSVEVSHTAGDGTEYYAEDAPQFDPLATILHPEAAQGGMTVVPGFNDVTTTAIDPQSFWAGGILWLDNATGGQSSALDIYSGSDLPDIVTFGKNNGLGDLEFRNNLSMEIGNRIWQDINANGIQDAGEPPFPGVTVQLFDVSGSASGELVGTTTTNTVGEYYFNSTNVTYTDGGPVSGPRPLTAYEIRIPSSEFSLGGQLRGMLSTVSGNSPALTPPTLQNVSGPAEFDSDLDGTADTARTQRINLLPASTQQADGIKVHVYNATGGIARVASDQTVVFEFADGNTSGNFEYTIIDDRLDSDAVGIDSDNDGVTDRAEIRHTTSAAGRTDHSLDFGFVPGRIDLEVQKTADRRLTVEGDTVAFFITLTNNAATATLPATGVTVADTLPAGVTLVPGSIDTSNGSFDGSTWTLSSPLPPGSTETLRYSVTVNPGTAGSVMLTSAQSASADQPDVDSTVANDDGDHSEDDEDDAALFVGTLTASRVSNSAQVIAADQPDFDSTPQNDDHDQSEDDESAVTYTLSTAAAVFDYGDLPDTYSTTIASGGPAHRRGTATFLGSTITDEADGQPSVTANTDTADDGIRFLTPIVAGAAATIEVTASTDGFLNAWIDFDGDGVLDEIAVRKVDGINAPAGTLVNDLPLSAGTHLLSVTVPSVINGPTAARFRYTADAMGSARAPVGTWPNGEVEDYVLRQLGDTVWFDQNADGILNPGTEAGLAGVTVVLSADLDSDGTLESFPTTTDAAGNYLFSGLPEGNYTVTVTPPTSLIPTFDLDGGNDHSSVVVIGPGQLARTDADFGYRGTGQIGDTVWLDSNLNGSKETSEPGLEAVNVQIVGDINGDALSDITLTTTTSPAGLYLFDHLVPGNYSVSVSSPAGLVPTFDADGIGTPGTSQTSLSFASANLSQDFGFRGTASIGSLVWGDLNADGIHNTGEPGIPGVTVQLAGDINGDGITDISATTSTDAAGGYQFTGLAAGAYSVSVAPPAGYQPTFDADGLVTPSASSVVLSPATADTTQNFGYRGNGIIGDLVWSDDNADAAFSTGELPLTGVSITLTGDLNGDSVPDMSQIALTDTSGNYEFRNLPPGSYEVRVQPPANSTQTFDADGTATPNTSRVVLNAGTADRSQDFGYQPESTGGGNTAVIGDLIWNDLNANGVADPGEPGLAAVTVQLTGDTNGDSVADVTRTVVTTSSGFYEFNQLAAGTYTVSVNRPAGFSPTFDSDGTATADTSTLTLSSGAVQRALDFGYTTAASTDVDVAITKKIANPENLAPVGSVVTYLVTATNSGPANAVNAVITDSLPSQFVSAQWTASGTPGSVFTAAGSGGLAETVSLPVGGSITWTIEAQLDANFVGTVTNTATATTSQTDTNTANNTSTHVTNVTPLTLTPETPLLPGEPFTIGARGMSHVSLVPFVVGTQLGSGIVNGVHVGIADPQIFMVGFVCVDDRIPGIYNVPSAYEGQTLYFQAFEAQPTPRLSNIITARVGAPRVIVRESASSSTVTEGSTADDFTVTLSHQPSSQVTVDISGNVPSRLAVSPPTLTFTPANWNSAQTVTLQAVDDTHVNGDVTAKVEVTVASNSDPDFLANTGQTLRVQVTDNDVLRRPGLSNSSTITVDQRPAITWAAVADAASYDLYISHSADVRTSIYDVNLTGTSFTPPADLGIGRFAVWVRARSATGQTSAWSTAARIDIVTPPALSPIAGGSNRRPQITWSPVPGAQSYELWINNSTTGTARVIHRTQLTETSFTPDADFGFGTHQVWVRANDQYGRTTNWSTAETFSVNPQLLAPLAPTFDPQPTFLWRTLPGAANYEIYIRTPNGVIRQSNLQAGSYTPATPLPQGAHRWWVRGFAANGNAGPWSDSADFNTEGRPVIVTPANGTTAPAATTFQWSEVPQAAKYSLYLERTDASGFVFRRDDVTATSLTYTPGLPTGSFRVWVRAIHTDGTLSPWSVPVSFSVAAGLRQNPPARTPQAVMATIARSEQALLNLWDAPAAEPVPVLNEKQSDATSAQNSHVAASGSNESSAADTRVANNAVVSHHAPADRLLDKVFEQHYCSQDGFQEAPFPQG